MGRWMLAILACGFLVGCRDYAGQKTAMELHNAYQTIAIGETRESVMKSLGEPASEVESKEVEDDIYYSRDPQQVSMLKVSYRRSEVVDVTLFFEDYRESKALGRIEN